jgi:hypothetical protein
MSKRRDADLVEDISEAIARIERYTAGLTLDAFLADTKTQDATVRNLEIIGEAVKGLSSDFKKKHQGRKLLACATASFTIMRASTGKLCGMCSKRSYRNCDAIWRSRSRDSLFDRALPPSLTPANGTSHRWLRRTSAWASGAQRT